MGIRQRNIERLSNVGHYSWYKEAEALATVTTVQRGIPIPQVEKVQLIDLTTYITVAISGGGTLQADIYKAAFNTLPTTVGGTLVKAGATGLTAVGGVVFDLRSVPPIDPRNPLLLAANPDDFVLAVRYTNTGTVTSVTIGFVLRWRPFHVTIDS